MIPVIAFFSPSTYAVNAPVVVHSLLRSLTLPLCSAVKLVSAPVRTSCPLIGSSDFTFGHSLGFCRADTAQESKHHTYESACYC